MACNNKQTKLTTKVTLKHISKKYLIFFQSSIIFSSTVLTFVCKCDIAALCKHFILQLVLTSFSTVQNAIANAVV